MEANKLSCKDLMIGDWVLHEGKAKKVSVIWGKYKVSLNDPREVWGSIYTNQYNYTDIEPIPLSADIIDKVIRHPNVSVFWCDNTTRNCYELSICKEREVALTIEISYVHELQHALRLCGITKDIEL